MTKLVLNNLGSLSNESTALATINGNSASTSTALENTLSRDGTSPNSMNTTLDMNNHQIYNLPVPVSANSPLRLQDLASFIGSGTIIAIPTGGTTGQVLTKKTSANYDVDWEATTAPSDATKANLAGGNTFTGQQVYNATGTAFDLAYDLYTDDGGLGTTAASFSATTYGGTFTGNSGGLFHGRLAGGTRASPSQAKAGNLITGVGGLVHTGAAFSTSSPSSMHYIAAEDQTLTNNGSYINFYTTPLATTLANRVNLLTLTQDSTVWIKDAGTFNPLDTTQTKPATGMKIIAASSGIGGANSIGAVAYGASVINGFRGYHASGTPAAPTGTAAGDQLNTLLGYGYLSGAWSAGANASIILTSAEAGIYSTGNTGSKITMGTTPVGSGSRSDWLVLNASGGLGVGVGAPDLGINSISAVGVIKSNGPLAGIGYATGAGSTVTQATNKTTGVTLNNVCGQITMNNASLASSATVAFTLTNSAIAATDVVLVNIASGATVSSYLLTLTAVAAGSCRIELRNYNVGALAEALVLNFAVIKAVAS